MMLKWRSSALGPRSRDGSGNKATKFSAIYFVEEQTQMDGISLFILLGTAVTNKCLIKKPY